MGVNNGNAVSNSHVPQEIHRKLMTRTLSKGDIKHGELAGIVKTNGAMVGISG